MSTGRKEDTTRCRMLSNASAWRWPAVCRAEGLAMHCSASDQDMLSMMLPALSLLEVPKLVQTSKEEINTEIKVYLTGSRGRRWLEI